MFKTNTSSNHFKKKNLESYFQFTVTNSTEFFFRKSICRFMLKFSRFYFQVRFRGITYKKLWEQRKLISDICSTICNFQSWIYNVNKFTFIS